MPDVGRFFNVDVLAEDYDYQTPYAFSENKVTNHVELEGLEAVAIGPGGVPVPLPPPTYGGSTTGLHPVGQGLWSKAKSNAANNWNGIIRHAGYNYNYLKAGATFGIVQGLRLLNSEGDDKGESGKAEGGKTRSKEKAGLADIPKPGKGKGTVEKKERDPKRTLSKKEKTELIEEKNNKCEGCGTDVTPESSDAHHTVRHADGGATTKENTNILCKECHKEVHKR